MATGRQLAAALALGAAGVNCGTRFAVTAESNWPQSFKERAVAAEETATVLMFRPLRNTARAVHTNPNPNRFLTRPLTRTLTRTRTPTPALTRT